MATIAVLLKADEKNLSDVLQGARQKLESAGGELVVDLSSLRRVDASLLLAMQEFATMAQGKGAKLVLRGVSVDLYRVMKLVKLTAAFSFWA
jgi:anti-anti-sigma regulatory factor